MALALTLPALPLRLDHDGVVRVGATRLTLATIVAAYEEGFSAEEIAEQYPSVPLADVHAAISFYLQRREDVAAYLQERARHSAQVRAANEAKFSPAGIRMRLIARRNSNPQPDDPLSHG